MRRIRALVLLIILIIASVVLGYSLSSNKLTKKDFSVSQSVVKSPLLRVALIADSHNENELLAKALRQAQGMGINFVIGLGDYTNLGTVEELEQAKAVFDNSKLEYTVTAGDRDGWDSRNRGTDNFSEVFGEASRVIEKENVAFVILDNSNIYSGISQNDWEILNSKLETPPSVKTTEGEQNSKLTFVFAHKTPFHPESKHVMGEDSAEVAKQAQDLLALLEGSEVNGFFSGDIHFFAQYQSPSQIVKITTIGAVAASRNFQGPRFALLTIYDDYSWEVNDIEIR